MGWIGWRYRIGLVCSNVNDCRLKQTKVMKIEIELPKGFMNIAVTKDNFLIADTNDSSNWDTLKIPLPEGEWVIHSVFGKVVTLNKLRL